MAMDFEGCVVKAEEALIQAALEVEMERFAEWRQLGDSWTQLASIVGDHEYYSRQNTD